MFLYLLYIYKKPIILSLFKIDTLNFNSMYILANLTGPLKTCVRLHNLISMNIFFIIKDRIFKNSDFLKSNFNEHSLHNKGLWFFFVIVKETLENK